MTNFRHLCGGRRPPRGSLAGATQHIFVFIAAGHLAAAAGTLADEVRSGWEEGTELGLFRPSLRGSSGARTLLSQSGELVNRGPASLLVPLPNDTISENYWATVNRLITQAGQQTPAPASLNDPAATPTPEPWKRIMGASSNVNVLDAKQAQNVLTDWEYATPQPWSQTLQLDDKAKKKMSVLPYDMQIGAEIMYSLSTKTSATPPPTQEFVDETFMSQCPMVMFTDSLRIKPPRCNNNFGSWTDPKSDRTILRWNENNKGGIYFGVDSKVSGEGSVNFAEVREMFSLNLYQFSLLNCMDVTRYTIEEKIIKVNHMAPKARSTVREHDISKSREAYFYKYLLRGTNGSTVAETNLYRMDQSEVNFTMYNGEMANGVTFAVAKRQGYWKRDAWRECRHPQRAWDIEFPMAQDNFATVATVQDLRVAAAAAVTLMAYRDEHVSADGFQHTGQGHMWLTLVKTVFFILIALMIACICWIAIIQQNLDKRLQWICFRLETVLLPKRPVHQRSPVLHPAY
mmetsp:Transcript_138619/g.431163  ORF Transcript_138619/g.431163 Transcript_138619/m.431163 type:complete len:515 (+) Transcript_138619:65-1609(+)